MLSPVNQRLWSYAGERLVDIKLIAGQFGANRIFDRACAGETVDVFLLPHHIDQALTLDILNYFALDTLFRNAGLMPLNIVIGPADERSPHAVDALRRYFECRILRDMIGIDTVIRTADLLKWNLLSKDGSSHPPSWHLMLAAFAMSLPPKQAALLVLYRSQMDLIQTLSRSLPQALAQNLGFIVIENPDERHLALGCPGERDAFSRAIRKLRTGTCDERGHRISTCESYRTLFHYDQHGPTSFSSEKLDSCYDHDASCSGCKQDVAEHLIQTYRRETSARATHA
jgi:hypothetical protein